MKRTGSSESEDEKRDSVGSLSPDDILSESTGKETRSRRPSYQLRRGKGFFRLSFRRSSSSSSSSDDVQPELDEGVSPGGIVVESSEVDEAGPSTGCVLGDVSLFLCHKILQISLNVRWRDGVC